MRDPGLRILLMALLPEPALAATPPAAPAPAPVEAPKLLMLPLGAFVDVSEEIRAEAQNALLGYLAASPAVQVIGPADFRALIEADRLHAGRLQLARDLASEGVRAYDRMQLDDAIGRLEKALDLFAQTHHRWSDPSEVAEAHLTLALARLERRERDKAHLAFKSLLAEDPGRDLKKGHYSKGAINAFGVARADFLSADDHDLPKAELARLGKATRSQYVIQSYVRSRARARTALETILFDVKNRRVLDRQIVPVDLGTAAWQVDRMASRLLACLSADAPTEDAPPPYPRGRRWQIGTALSSVFFGKRNLPRENFLSMGLSVHGAFLVSPHLVALGHVGFATSTEWHLNEDNYRDLRNDLATFRSLVAIGPHFATSRGGFGAHLVVGLEGLAMDDLRTTRDAGCKWGPPYACDGPTTNEAGLAFGPVASGGVSLALLGPVTLQLEVAVSYYVFNGTGNELNLPVRAELGFGYRF